MLLAAVCTMGLQEQLRRSRSAQDPSDPEAVLLVACVRATRSLTDTCGTLQERVPPCASHARDLGVTAGCCVRTTPPALAVVLSCQAAWRQ